MGRWKLWFVLLLQQTVCADSQETGPQLVKTIGRKPHVAPICVNSTLHIVTLIVCRLRTEECKLLYRYGEDFVHECDPRFTLMTVNQTVFLRLTGLTPLDSGNYACECSHVDGTYTLNLNITVEADEDADTSTERPFLPLTIAVLIFIVITGVILGFIRRKSHHRRQPEQLTSHTNAEPGDVEPYSSYIQRENELYVCFNSTRSPNITPFADTFDG